MTYEVKSLNEECGIFGIWGHSQAAQVTYFGLHSLQHRGQEGAGILSNDHGKLKRHRDLGLVAEVFKNPADLDNLTGEAAIGHVRYATSGGASINNVQPFFFSFYDMQMGLAHNGNLTNAHSLRRELEKKGSIFASSSDTEILMHLIRHSKQENFLDKLKESLRRVQGGFAYLIMREDKLYAALDPNGFRPLSIGRMKNGAWVVSSETCAFEVVGAEWLRDLEPGEIVIIDDKGVTYDSWGDGVRVAAVSSGELVSVMVMPFGRVSGWWRGGDSGRGSGGAVGAGGQGEVLLLEVGESLGVALLGACDLGGVA